MAILCQQYWFWCLSLWFIENKVNLNCKHCLRLMPIIFHLIIVAENWPTPHWPFSTHTLLHASRINRLKSSFISKRQAVGCGSIELLCWPPTRASQATAFGWSNSLVQCNLGHLFSLTLHYTHQFVFHRIMLFLWLGLWSFVFNLLTALSSASTLLFKLLIDSHVFRIGSSTRCILRESERKVPVFMHF